MSITVKYNFWENLEANPQACDRFWDSAATRCVVCGRDVKNGVQVEIGTDGFEFGTTDCETLDACYSIGSECVKTVRGAKQ